MTALPTLQIEPATLVKAQILNEYGDILADWKDNLGTYSAIHGQDGRVQTKPEGTNPPRLTADQVAAATLPEHPAYALARKGSEAQPHLANRMEKAAQLVEAGLVVLVQRPSGEQTATVKAHKVNGRSCDCKWQEIHPGDWCSHALAARMARALNQPVITVHVDGEPDKMMDKTSDVIADIRPAKEDTLRRQAVGHRAIMAQERAFRDWCNTSADAGRRYVLAAAGAGRVAATSDSRLHAKQVQARKYQDSPELAAAKKRALAELGIGGN